MILKRILACLLAALMCVTLFTACNKTEEESTADTSAAETESGTEAETGAAASNRFDYFNTDLTPYITIDRSVYSNMKVELSSDYIIDNEDVQTYVESERIANRVAKNGTEQVTDQPIAKGDSAFIYYKGFLDGEEFEGGSNWDDDEPFELVIGSGSFVPGFEDGLIGVIPANTSEENPFPVNVTFPENYYENLAGKAVVFNVWVVYSVEYELPAYDDAFITETLEYVPQTDNVKEEFEAHLLEQLKAEMATYEQTAIRNSIWEQLLDQATVTEYPESEIEYYYNSYLDQYEYYMQYYTYYGYSFATLDEFVIAYLGLDEGADWKAETRESCKIDVAQNLVFHAIAQNEDIIITDTDYQNSIQYYVDYYTSQGYSYTAEDVEQGLGADFLKQHALFEKVNTMLIANCTVTYGD
ncbi:MAG: FKBP-type peptidyl-prolyl cis-trans isomerase [Clostridia bacterium]|nr:FKBP-type peptidyl-prolyl cis-trans isomerase [Clostridia bacterium]